MFYNVLSISYSIHTGGRCGYCDSACRAYDIYTLLYTVICNNGIQPMYVGGASRHLTVKNTVGFRHFIPILVTFTIAFFKVYEHMENLGELLLLNDHHVY